MKLFQITVFTVVAFCATFAANGQVSYRTFDEQKDLNVKSEMALELWNYYLRFNLDSLKIVSVDLLLAASENEHEFARAVGTRMLGSYLFRTGKIDQGLEYLDVARNYFEKKEDYMVASEIYNEIGHAYTQSGKLEEAKKAYNKSLRLGEQSPDATAAFNAKLGLGKLYVALGDTNVGMSLVHSYKQLALQNQKFEAASDAFSFLAMIEGERGNRNLSLEYYMSSVEYSKRSESKVHLAHSYANMGILKFGLEEYDSSLHYFKESLRLRLEMKAVVPIIEAYYNLGFFYMERDSIETSIQNFNNAVELARIHEHYQQEIDAITELVAIYNQRGEANKVKELSARIKKLELLIEEKKRSDDKSLNAINIDFDKKKARQKPEDGIGWVTFTITVLAVLMIFFLFLERRRFN